MYSRTRGFITRSGFLSQVLTVEAEFMLIRDGDSEAKLHQLLFVFIDRNLSLAILVHRPTQALQRIQTVPNNVSCTRRLRFSDLKSKKIHRRDELALPDNLL